MNDLSTLVQSVVFWCEESSSLKQSIMRGNKAWRVYGVDRELIKSYIMQDYLILSEYLYDFLRNSEREEKRKYRESLRVEWILSGVVAGNRHRRSLLLGRS